MRASSNALRPREQPGRLEQPGGLKQHHHDDTKNALGGERAGRDVAGADPLKKGGEKSAEGRAGDVAGAAEDDDRERFRRGGVAQGGGEEKTGAKERTRRG